MLSKTDARTLSLFPADPALPAQPSVREFPVELPRPKPVAPLAPALRQPPDAHAQPRKGQLWIAIHLSRLALDCLRLPEIDARPLAIVDASDRMQTVLACNPVASSAGVRAGQPLNAALALESSLETRPRDALGEQTLLEQIAAWCHRFTPVVSLEPPDELLLEVKGSLRLFGGASALMESVAEGLRSRGIEASLALTPTPRSAVWLARSRVARRRAVSDQVNGRRINDPTIVERPEDLARNLQPLPLPVLRWPGEIVQRLVSMGVRTTGGLLRLPRAGLARRIGPQCVIELDQALGRHAEARRRFRAPERFDERVSLECEVEAIDRVTRTMEPVLHRLQRFLRVREAAIAALMLRLEHRAGPPTLVRLGLAAPTSDVAHLHSLLREKLSKIELRAPVTALRLRSSALLASIAANASLPCALPRQVPGAEGCEWFASPAANALPRLIERLQARLGRAGVFGITSLDDHRPERAWRATALEQPPAKVSPQAANTFAGPGEKNEPSRPFWLLPDPEPLFGWADPQPEAASCDERGWQIESGPERLESGWWDGNDLMRDYFIARNPRGIRSWVYRDRRAPHRWYLHGLFG
jgi:protein ImuB